MNRKGDVGRAVIRDRHRARRERLLPQVIDLWSRDMTYEEVAARVGIAPSTVGAWLRQYGGRTAQPRRGEDVRPDWIYRYCDLHLIEGHARPSKAEAQRRNAKREAMRPGIDAWGNPPPDPDAQDKGAITGRMGQMLVGKGR